jgi:hypothetical protein
LPLGWAWLVLVFFSLSPGKRDVYILPLLPMVALALAPLLAGLLRRRGPRRLLFALTLSLALVLALAAAVAMLGHPAWAQRMEQGLDPRLWRVLLAIGIAGIIAALMTRVRHAAPGWLLFAGVLWMLYGLWGYPVLNGERSARDVMREAREVAGAGAPIGLVAWKEQNLLMAQGPVVEFGFLQSAARQFAAAVRWQRQDRARRWVFIRGSAMGDCVDRRQAVNLGRANQRDWWMFRAAAVRPGCFPGAGAKHASVRVGAGSSLIRSPARAKPACIQARLSTLSVRRCGAVASRPAGALTVNHALTNRAGRRPS